MLMDGQIRAFLRNLKIGKAMSHVWGFCLPCFASGGAKSCGHAAHLFVAWSNVTFDRLLFR
jgi:hypothetical protein